MELSKREKRKLRFEKINKQTPESHQMHERTPEQQRQVHERQSKSRKTKYYVVAAVIGVILLAIIGFSVYSLSKPGSYDSFAKCISEKGAVMYGAMDWCKYTQAQKAMFGNSFKYLNYREHQELPGIRKTPTWVINGVWYENVQSFDKLAALTGCKL